MLSISLPAICYARRSLLPNALSDYTIEMSGGEQVKKVKADRQNALCFDYQQLKDMFWIDLEMKVMTYQRA